MQRDLSKAIEEYNALCKSKGGNFGAFYVSDYEQLRNIATDKGGISFWNIVLYSLSAGFMIGYKAAKREQKHQLRMKK